MPVIIIASMNVDFDGSGLSNRLSLGRMLYFKSHLEVELRADQYLRKEVKLSVRAGTGESAFRCLKEAMNGLRLQANAKSFLARGTNFLERNEYWKRSLARQQR